MAAESRLVTEFYRLWGRTNDHQPTERERSQAVDLMERYGDAETMKLLPKVVRRMKEKFPEAKYFGAAIKYFEEVAVQRDRYELATAKTNEPEQKHRNEAQAQAHSQAELTELEGDWDRLSVAEKDEIRIAALRNQPESLLHNHPQLVHRWCVMELARRRRTALHSPRRVF